MNFIKINELFIPELKILFIFPRIITIVFIMYSISFFMNNYEKEY